MSALKPSQLQPLVDRYARILQPISQHLPDGLLEHLQYESARLEQQFLRLNFPIVFCSVFSRGQTSAINALLQAEFLPVGWREGLNGPLKINIESTERIRISGLASDQTEAVLQHIARLSQAARLNNETEDLNRLDLAWNSGLPTKWLLLDFPAVQYMNVSQMHELQKIIGEQAKAVVFIKGAEDLAFDHPEETKFLDALRQDFPALFSQMFVLVNRWDQIEPEQQAAAGAQLSAAIKQHGYPIPPERIYKVSARNYLILQQILRQSGECAPQADALLRYADLDQIFGDPESVLQNHAELSEFERFKHDLIAHVETTAAAEFVSGARASLLHLIDQLGDYLRDNLAINADTQDNDNFAQHYREGQVEQLFAEFRGHIAEVLQTLAQDSNLTDHINWSAAEQNALLRDIQQVLLHPQHGQAKPIINRLNQGGIAVPETSRFVTELFEAIRLDERIVASLEQAAASREKLEQLKFDLKQPYQQFWFDALDKRLDEILDPEYVVMRIYGILENIITWRNWLRDLEKKINAANLESVEQLLVEINAFLIKNQDKLRERVQQTLTWHFHRYLIPKLQQLFALDRPQQATEFTIGVKNRIRDTLNQYGDQQGVNEQLAQTAALKRQTLAELSLLKQEIYQR